MKSNLKLVTVSLFSLLSSCAIGRQDYGFRKIQKNKDTASVKIVLDDIRHQSITPFESGSYKGTGNGDIQYRLLRPIKKADKDRLLPLVVVFHGSGAVGNNNESQMGVLAKLWSKPEIQDQYPAYVLVPQFPTRSSNYLIDSSRHVLTSAAQSCMQTSLELIDSLKRVLNIDTQRIYVIGFSMGGSTVINALSERPDLFAAAVSLSGIPQFDKLNLIKEIPIWLIHGNMDTENPMNSDVQFFKEIKDTHKVRFWECEDLAHNDILAAILPVDIIPKWLFSKRKQ